ncbi:MAG: carbohydrate ABC transporter permease [Armatimonadetes bacterium]|nr:carbohydrate ABC transporter permease [Armatimonadota bacterium]
MIKRFVLYIFLCAYAVVVIYPLLWVGFSSLRATPDINRDPWGLPSQPRWENYSRAWIGEGSSSGSGLAGAFVNSSIATTVSLGLILLFGSMASYVLARFVFAGSGVIYNIFLFGMMFPVFLGIIPLFFLLDSLGGGLEAARLGLLSATHMSIFDAASWTLLGSLPGLIIAYVAYSLSFTVFILTGFFRTLPGELAEAGAIDGCSHWGVFWRIMLPLARPGLITAAIFNAIGLWNEYPLALVLTGDNTRTLPLAIADLAQTHQYQTDQGALFAGIVIVIIPTLVGYILFQNKLTAGLTAGAVKG